MRFPSNRPEKLSVTVRRGRDGAGNVSTFSRWVAVEAGRPDEKIAQGWASEHSDEEQLKRADKALRRAGYKLLGGEGLFWLYERADLFDARFGAAPAAGGSR